MPIGPSGMASPDRLVRRRSASPAMHNERHGDDRLGKRHSGDDAHAAGTSWHSRLRRRCVDAESRRSESAGEHCNLRHTVTVTVTVTAAADTEAARLLTKVATHMEAMSSAHFEKRTPDESVTGDFSSDGIDTDYALTLSLPAAQIEGMQMLEKDGVAYVSMGGLTAAGKFAKLDATSKVLGPLLAVAKGLRLGSAFADVAPAVETVKDLGPSTISGDSTEHYLLLIDSAKAHSLLNPGVAVPDSVSSQIPKTFHYNLFVTKDWLVRRVQFEVLGKATEMDYTDWGAPVHISAPPPSSIVTAPAGF
jgi:hypothetical protein